MLLALRATADIVNERRDTRTPAALRITTGNPVVRLVASSQPSALAIDTTLAVDLAAAPNPGSSLVIPTGPATLTFKADSLQINTGLAVSLTPALTPSRLTIATGPLAVTVNGAALRPITTGIQVALIAGQRGTSLTIPTGITVSLTAGGAAFSFSRDLVIAAQTDLATTTLDRPVLLGITFTDQDFRSFANDGRIQQTGAEDVQFALISGGTVLNHNIVSHDPINGTIIFDLQLPNWDVTTDVPVRMSYGFVGQMTGTIAIGTRTLVQLTAGTAPPANIELPLIAGLNPVGSTLTCSQGRWSGTFPQDYAYRWRRGGVDIPGGLADDQSYITVAADVGLAVDCRVTASSIPFPAGVPALSSNSVTVTNTATAPVNDTPPRITPTTAGVGDTLSCSQGVWIGTAPITYTYRWLRNGTNIGGALGGNSTYLTITADDNQVLTCRVTASNGITPDGVEISENSVTVNSSGTGFVRYIEMEIDKAARAGDIIRPAGFNTQTANSYRPTANQIIDVRQRTGFQRTDGSFATQEEGAVIFRLFNPAAGSVLCGGKVTCTNDFFKNQPWHVVHGNETWSSEAHGNFSGLRVDGLNNNNARIQGFYLKHTMDGIVPQQFGSNAMIFENGAIIETRDDCMQDDGGWNFTFRNVYFQGYVWMSCRSNATKRALLTFENCLIHMKRFPFTKEEDPPPNEDFGVPGSKRVGPYISPTQRNSGLVARTAQGHAHKWFLKTEEVGNNTGLFRARLKMKDCLLRIDTIPGEGLNNPGVFPNEGDGTDPGSVNGSSYDNVHVCWLGSPADSTGHGRWPFTQNATTLAGMGITLHGGDATDASEQDAIDLWNRALNEFNTVNGYRASDDTFSWNRVGG